MLTQIDHEWQRFTVGTFAFEARVEYDQTSEAPWDREDGHGPVSDWVTRAKRPGERVLSVDTSGYRRYYDMQAAMAKALAEGWNAPPFDEGTPSQRAARAVEADYQHLRGWCLDHWCYVGVVVAPVCPCCDSRNESASVSLWGIESNDDAYLLEAANALVAEWIAANTPDACEPASQATHGETA